MCIKTAASESVVVSQTQTEFGIVSHLVAMYCESKLHSIDWIPVGGPFKPTWSKVLCRNAA